MVKEKIMSIAIVKPEEIKNEIMSFFKNKSIIPIVGAGLTCGIKSKTGKFHQDNCIRNI